MSNLINAIKKKGVSKSIERGRLMLERYGLNDKKMKENIALYNNLLMEHNVKATIFVPLIVWEEYKDYLKKFTNLEFAIHGQEHIDYTKASEDVIFSHVMNCRLALQTDSELIKGWRSPYLQTNDKLFAELEQGFKFDSSKTTISNVGIKRNEAYELALEIYQPDEKKNYPYQIGRLLEIPIMLPDDEMLIDRLGLHWEEALRIWAEIMRANHFFVLQLHPERISILEETLRELIMEARRLGIPIMPLSEITEDITDAFVITGDLDRLSII